MKWEFLNPCIRKKMKGRNLIDSDWKRILESDPAVKVLKMHETGGLYWTAVQWSGKPAGTEVETPFVFAVACQESWKHDLTIIEEFEGLNVYTCPKEILEILSPGLSERIDPEYRARNWRLNCWEQWRRIHRG